ncbi:LacI family DNA-binding transcriptional regulator [Microbacterium nymphoidis]|uniref:LacI family DNA-binding transcriptional regulator n=1 Tax=Microbacterium nymphoidis TaxID=2898586 RepID=UPI001E284FF1|nr:LacI family DNA-binding transcriptional regulator [Microbacterium nymphoidis]MCD2500028.1 LacI family transcriptional regulator [Microbacterium nymphoidis]
MARRPTVYDVAKLAGVSTATVSFAFRRPDQVRDSTREAVLDAARELGYVPSGAARGLARGGTGVLGLQSFDLLTESDLLSSDEHAPTEDGPPDPRVFPLYVDEVQRGFELECRRRGWSVHISNDPRAPQDVTDHAGRVDGLAVFPSRAGLSGVAGVLESVVRTVPVVLFSMGGVSADEAFHRVQADNNGGARALITHLVDHHGARRFSFIGDLAAPDYQERFTAITDELTARGLARPATPLIASEGPPTSDHPSAPDDIADHATSQVADDIAASIADVPATELPDALVCASDQIAIALIERLERRGISVPGDVIVTGFDGILASRVLHPTLTTVRQPMAEMGRAAARILIEEAEQRSGTGHTVILPTTLMLGESCGCIPG